MAKSDFDSNQLSKSLDTHDRDIQDLKSSMQPQKIIDSILPIIKNSGKDVREAFKDVIEDITKDKFWRWTIGIGSVVISSLIAGLVSYLVAILTK